MASNAPSTTALDAKAISPRSPILAMHLRYETALAEYNVVDQADTPETDRSTKWSYERAKKANVAESDALRTAILYQVPDTFSEAMLLQYHIEQAYDLVINATKADDDEQEAVTVAIHTLFDFLACENNDDHEALGASFKAATMRVFNARRLRTGEVEA